MKPTRLEIIKHLTNVVNANGTCSGIETESKFKMNTGRCTNCPLAHDDFTCNFEIIKDCMKDVLKEYLFSDNPGYTSKKIVKEAVKRKRNRERFYRG